MIVSTDDCDKDRQQKWQYGRHNRKYFYLCKTTVGIKIPTTDIGYQPRRAQRKCPQAIAIIMTDPEIAMWPPKLEIVISLELRQDQKFNGKSEIFDTASATKCSQATATTADNQNGNVAVLGANFVISGCPSLLQLLSDTFIELATVENPGFAVEISTLSVVVTRYINTFGFGGHIATFCCRLMWQLHFVRALYDITISGFGGHFRLMSR